MRNRSTNFSPNMCKHAGSRILFLLLVLGAPLTVCAQSFSVEPGDPVTNSGFGLEPEPTEFFEGTEFTFTADVMGAKCYELDFGDDDKKLEKPPDSDGRAVERHRYETPREYTAVMRAWRNRDCDDNLSDGDLSGLPEPIKLELTIKVIPRPAVPQPRPSHARFSVTPSDPSDPIIGDIEVTWADFTFTADVSQAKGYELDFGDGGKKLEKPPEFDGRAVEHHRYAEPGEYTAKMIARRNADELVEIDLIVSVQASPPAVAVQWPPPVRLVASVPPEPAKSDTLTWLLLLAAVAILLSRVRRLAGTDPVTFEPMRDRGGFEVTGGDVVVSMRVRRDEPQFVISDDAALLGARVRRNATRVDS